MADFGKEKEKPMTAAQMMRAQRRAERARLEREQRTETLAAIMALVLVLAAFMVAGTMDAHDEQVYREGWYEAHGID